MTDAQYLAGRLLLALPGMGDERFDRAVIALCMHGPNGAFGIAVGKQAEGVSFHQLMAEIDIDATNVPDCPVLEGGPVEPGRGFVLHSPDWSGPGTVEAPPFGALSVSLDVLKAIAGDTGPKRWLFALGYAGWAPGQLEGEMQRHGWYAASGHPEILFDVAPEDRWHEAWRAEGVDPALLANTTGRA